MQVFEILFLVLLAVAVLHLAFGPFHRRLSDSTLAVAGIALIALGAAVEGWRWQMLPAQLALAIVMLSSLRRARGGRIARALGAGVATILLGMSAFLAHQLPVLALPAPAGAHGVGTLEYSVTDTSRIERYAPNRHRELYVEVWYPADSTSLRDYPVRTLYQELYEGDFTVWRFLAGYLRHVRTHAHIEAPIARPSGERFPVLLFNHGLDGFTSQNQLMMEHLASHGYVIFSVAHPYQSMRVNLAGAGTVRAASAPPADLGYRLDELETDLMDRIIELHDDREAVSAVRTVLLRVADTYETAEDDSERRSIVTAALEMEALRPYRHLMTEKSLSDYLVYVHDYQGRAVEYWVQDIQFIADTLSDLNVPVDGFSEVLDTGRLGVFGMSMGGAAAGEFCKIDSRCRAGTNLDGTQGGRHWDTKVAAPFMMIYHERHRGGNDYAYLPPTHDFWDLTVAGTTHFDFVEIAYTMPLLKTLGLAGEIDGLRTIEIVDEAHLRFFDRYLKGIPVSTARLEEIPELDFREHAIE